MRRKAVIFTTSAILTILMSFTVYSIAKPEVYLKTGNTIRFTNIYDSGAKRTSAVQIESATSVNGTTTVIAKSSLYDEAGKFVMAYKYKFYCDSLNWCVDPLNYMFISYDDASPTKWVYESDSLVYPLNMKAGDTLIPALAAKTLGAKGMSQSESQFTYNRKVVKNDTIKTQIGDMIAWKIESKVSVKAKSEYGNMGTTSDEYTMAVTEWFHPQYGVVMSERAGKYGTNRIVIQALK